MSIIRRIKVNDLRSPTHHGIHRLHAQSAFLENFFRGYKETLTGAMGDEEISLKYDNVLVTAPLFFLLVAALIHLLIYYYHLAKCSG